MGIEEHLLQGEEVKARLGDLYVTPKRLIRYQGSRLGESLDEVPHSHIACLSLVGRSNRPLVYIGAIVLGVGVVLGLLRFILSAVSSQLGWSVPGLPSPILFVVIGLALVAGGFLWRQNQLEVWVGGLDQGKAKGRFRIGGARRKEAKAFLDTLRGLLYEQGEA